MPIRPSDPFFWRHYEGPIILVCVRWYLRLPLSYRQVADLMKGLGIHVHASCIWRWVQVFGPELDKRCRPHLKPTNKSYRVDETILRLKAKTGTCIGRWIRPGRPSISCSPPSAMLLQPSVLS
jgi:transposase-like protein